MPERHCTYYTEGQLTAAQDRANLTIPWEDLLFWRGYVHELGDEEMENCPEGLA